MLNSKALKLLAIGALTSAVAASIAYASNDNHLSQASTVAATPVSFPTARYQEDLLKNSRSLLEAIAQSTDLKGKRIRPEIVLEEMTFTDLDGDGYPEVFGRFRQGLDPTSPAAANQTTQDATLYATTWISYSSSTQPPVRITGGSEYVLGNKARPPYRIEAIADLNGDGIKEVIIQNREDSAEQFEILEYKGNEGVLALRMIPKGDRL